VNLKDYIRGERHGAGAHDLELEAMRDPLLADALDGYNAVPGDHSTVLEGLEGRIRHSATGGRASARSQASRRFERRVRGWSVAVAAALVGVVIAGGVWIFGSDVPAENDHTARQNEVPTAEVEPYLPPVSVERTPLRATEADASRLGRGEIRSLGAGHSAEHTSGLASRSDTTTTAAFRSYIRSRGAAVIANGRANVGANAVTLRFSVGADGRPRDIEVASLSSPSSSSSLSPETVAAAKKLLAEGPDWPAAPTAKAITVAF